MKNGSKAPIFLNRRVRLNANQAAIVSLRMKNYNELSDNKQVCIVPNSNSCCFRKIILEYQECSLRQCLVEYS